MFIGVCLICAALKSGSDLFKKITTKKKEEVLFENNQPQSFSNSVTRVNEEKIINRKLALSVVTLALAIVSMLSGGKMPGVI